MRGRDVTNRNLFHLRGMNLEEADDGGKRPFPVLAHLEATELEYALQWRDRFIHKAKGQSPVAVLKEFWQDQAPNLEGVYQNNAHSNFS